MFTQPTRVQEATIQTRAKHYCLIALLWLTGCTTPPPQQAEAEWNKGIGNLISLGKVAVFSTYHPHDGTQLWRTDGTTEGTRLLQVTPPDFTAAIDSRFETAPPRTPAGALFWGQHQDKLVLWKTDGTEAGTTPLHRFPLHDATQPAYGTSFIPLAERVLFWADDGQHGTELWGSDGTTEGTRLLADASKDIASSKAVYPPGTPSFLLAGQFLYFTVPDLRDHGQYTNPPSAYSLWRSDGTPQGTRRITQLTAPSQTYPGLLHIMGDTLFYGQFDSRQQQQLWTLNLNTGQKALIHSFASMTMDGGLGLALAANGNLYFWYGTADQRNNITELWRTNGTHQGTQRLFTLLNPEYRFYSEPFTFANQVYFFGLTEPEDGFNGFPAQNPPAALWRTDGTRKGTLPLSVPHMPDEYAQQKPFVILNNNKLLFVAAEFRPAPESWLQVVDVAYPDKASVLGKFTEISFLAHPGERLQQQALYFLAAGDLWQTDGSAAGTRKIISLGIPPEQRPSHSDSDAIWPAAGPVWLDNGTWLFSPAAKGSLRGHELWATDGTSAGTKQLWAFPGK